MTEPRERALSAGWMTLFWIVGVALVTAALWGGYYWGQGSATQTNANARIDTVEKNTAARTDTVEKNTTARMDRIEHDVWARFDHDEAETKQTTELVHTVSDRLTRIEATLELIVKNITNAGHR
jgi:hypothetical protein